MASARWLLAAAALLLALPVAQAAIFLTGVKNIVPKHTAALVESIPGVAQGSSPEAVAKAVSQGVAKTIPAGVADTIVSSGIKDSASDLKDSVSDGRVADSLRDTAGSLKDAAEQTLEHVPASVDAAQSADSDSIASALREAAPQVASAVNRTSLQVAEAVQAHIPHVIAALNKTGHQVADQLDGGKGKVEKLPQLPSGSVPTDSREAPVAANRGWAPLSGGLLLVLTMGAGYLVMQRYKGADQAAPLLLSEALEGTSGPSSGRPAREPAIQMEPAQESLFQKF